MSMIQEKYVRLYKLILRVRDKKLDILYIQVIQDGEQLQLDMIILIWLVENQFKIILMSAMDWIKNWKL